MHGAALRHHRGNGDAAKRPATPAECDAKLTLAGGDGNFFSSVDGACDEPLRVACTGPGETADVPGYGTICAAGLTTAGGTLFWFASATLSHLRFRSCIALIT